MSPPLLPNDLPGVQRQVRDLCVAVNLFWTFAILMLAALALGSFTFGVPRFERIFDDMIPGEKGMLRLATSYPSYRESAPRVTLDRLLERDSKLERGGKEVDIQARLGTKKDHFTDTFCKLR